MKLTKKTEVEITQFLQKYWDTYFEGDLTQWQSFITEDYKNIGTNQEEIWNSKNEILEYTHKVLDQMIGRADVRNKKVQIISYEPYIMTHELGDLYVKAENKWNYYAPIRLSSLLQKNKEGWVVLHQHGSFPDSKTQEGEAFALDALKAENKKLVKAVKKRTAELETKNRELEIEGALQRIRAAAVAMKESKDLLDIVVTMRTEFTRLGHEAHYFWHMMWHENTYEKAMTSGDGTKIGFVMELPRHIHGDIPLLAKWEKSKKPTVVYAMEVEEAIDYVDKMVALGDFKNIDPQAPSHDDIRHIGGLTFIMARTTHGEIGYSLPGVIKTPPKEDIDLLVKFAGAFDLAHQRFLDLQKAEAQARETQIELALEKVRSRTMAMQHSDELQEASFLLDQQVRALGIKTWGCAFNIYGENESTEWFGNEAGVLHTYTVPREGIFKKYYQQGQKGASLVIQEFSGEACIAHYEYMSTLPVIGDVLKILKKTNNGFPTFQIDHVVYFKYGYLLFITRESVPEAHQVFERFAKVFEQTYTRFLDLQKAEQQAREVQIELALEKVRSRSMAMHTTTELQEVINIVHTELLDLNLSIQGGSFITINKDITKELRCWGSGGTANTSEEVVIPYYNKPFYTDLVKRIKKGPGFFTEAFTQKEKKEFFTHLFTYKPWSGLSTKEKKESLNSAGGYTRSCYVSQHTSIFIINHFGNVFSEAENDILIRFGKVFEQTYTRFLDLQKAEEQARESQIEAALERVRSRSMAMHKSEELLDAGALLYRELSALGVNNLTTGYILFNEDATIGHSYGVNPADGSIRKQPVAMIHNETKVMKSIVASWRIQEAVKVIELNPKETVKHQTYIAETSKNFPLTAAQLLAISPKRLIIHCFNFKQGYLLIVGGNRLSDEQQDMVVRFAKVFQQTYTRFLDLQKAEALARESQIEAALEKIRSRSLAMQKPDELQEVVSVVAKKLQELGVIMDANGVIICTYFPDNKDVMHWISSPDGSQTGKYLLPYFDNPIFKDAWESKRSGAEYFSKSFSVKDKNKFFKYAFAETDYKHFPDDFKEWILKNDKHTLSFAWQKNSAILIPSHTGIVPNDSEKDILKRFSKVFEQAYTRYLDLQKAEEQAREALIEASLERVRSRSIGMQTSRELAQVVQILDEELLGLGIEVDGTQILTDFDNAEKNVTVWFGRKGQDYLEKFHAPYFNHPIRRKIHTALKKGVDFYTEQYGKTDKDNFFKLLFENSDFRRTPQERKQFVYDSPGLTRTSVLFKNSILIFQRYHLIEFSEKEVAIFNRFGKVFEQAYTRFVDLQKAEAQAREAQIEAALERVRSRSMAMHESEEIGDVAFVLFEQLKSLGGKLWGTGFVFCKKDSEVDEFWFANEKGIMPHLKIPNNVDETHRKMYQGWQNKLDLFTIEKDGKELKGHYKYMLTVPDVQPIFQGMLDEGIAFPTWQKWHAAYFKYGYLLAITTEPYKNEAIFKRFAKVFEQAYTRFLDLQRAEAQAREAQIEAALEKVRSRTMAMQHSNELPDAANVLFTEVQKLGIPAWSCGYNILSEDKKSSTCIMSSEGEIQSPFVLPLTKHKSLKPWHKAILNNEKFFVYEQGGKDLEQHYAYMQSLPELRETFRQLKDADIALPTFQVNHLAKFTNGFLLFITYERVPEAHDIFKRFGKVFQQTYTRFLDLQKAETQAREAKIEASLEKVRSVALSLQKSDDMLDIAKVLYEQLLDLGFSKIRNAIIDIHNDEEETFIDYDYSHDMSSAITKFSFYGDPVIEQQIQKVQSGHDAFFEIELKGKQLEELIATRLRNGEKDDPRLRETDHLTYNLYSFGNGAIGISNFGVLSVEQKVVLKRFRNVFTFAYKRYTDLAHAEAQAREAKIESALEKVRSVALSMNESTDLLHIAKALYEQLLELGFNDIRNALIDVNNEDKQTFLDYDYSEEMGGTVTLMSYDDDPTLEEQLRVIANTTDGFSEMVLEGQQLQDLIDMRRNNGEADDPRLFNTDSVSYNLYAFGNGAVGISNFGVLNKDEKNILDRFRNVFTFAYQRFRDLQVKEEQSAALLAEKQQLEKTLTDLQQTQKQLIQSEKMASLGELTAGIAHEIQNPLNFVNNFSEVSNELIEEIDEELANGDMEEVKLLLTDIKQNLEKINHHGKRADAIVKGMLQHSRKSTAEKVPTDINKLADEYLRLAYHGLRAKDKSFNATLETDFDESIGLINVIPQDLGRVILNLITNAFYATNERKKVSEEENFKPSVSISTKYNPALEGGKRSISISVQDNGYGIPKQVVDKIFQPFFTTKPTGEGTGLGLSMSYDIVTKGHGGEFKVKTKIGKGTTFIILIPT